MTHAATCARPLVSVIVPCYNCEAFIADTVRSIQAQTLSDIEIIIVDDASTDGSREVVGALVEKDSRIHLLVQPENLGVAQARNRGLFESQGRYVAYLDSDDCWVSEKLARQLAFMQRDGYGASATSYETINENGTHRNYVHIPASTTYRKLLKNTVIATSTVMVDTEVVDKSLLEMPDIRKGQDFATWLGLLKAGHTFHGLDECLTIYRKRSGSLSSSPVQSAKRTWNIYRNVEHLNFVYATWCLAWQLWHAVLKRTGKRV